MTIYFGWDASWDYLFSYGVLALYSCFVGRIVSALFSDLWLYVAIGILYPSVLLR